MHSAGVLIISAFIFGALAGALLLYAAMRPRLVELERALYAFDHDGDGRPGGSKKRRPF